MSRSLPWALAAAALATGCLDVAGEPELGTEVSALGNFPDLAPRTVQVTSANGGGCMDLPVGLPAGSVLWLQQYPCNTGSNQRLSFESVGSGQFRIHSSFDNTLCLDVPSGNFAAGQDVQFFPCHSGTNQRWTVSAQSATFGTISPAPNAGLCLDVENASTGVAHIQLFGCGSPVATNRQWRFRTFLGSGSGPSCTGNITLGSATLLPGTEQSFAVGAGNIGGTCNSVVNPTFVLNCPTFPTNTNWVVATRPGTSAFPIACFRQ